MAAQPATIGALEQALVQRLAARFTVPGNAHPTVDVIAWQNDPRSYKMLHPLGACMVIYRGSSFNAGKAISGQLLAWEAEFEIGVLARTLREHQPPAPGAAPGVGAYDLLHTVRTALLGWRPALAAAALRMQRETFDDYSEGVWGYSLRTGIPMVDVVPVDDAHGPWIDAGCTDEPLLTRVTYAPGDYGAHVVSASQTP